MQATATNTDVHSLLHILSKTEDVATVLDRPIVISSATDTGCGFKLSIELVNGRLDIRMAATNTLLYTPDDTDQAPKTIGFLFLDTSADKDHGKSFDRAFRQILKIDRLNGEEDPDQHEEN
jgi:hypothetical protein